MAFKWVKLKFSSEFSITLTGLAFVTFIASGLNLLPSQLVETWYARILFPIISSLIVPVGLLVSSSLLDLILPGATLLIIYLGYRGRYRAILGLLASSYLIFFWTWGVNYHRQPVEAKLDFQSQRVTAGAVSAFVEEAAKELNQAYIDVSQLATLSREIDLTDEADVRIRSVIEAIDGPSSFRRTSPIQVKTSHLLNPFFRAGTVDGMFNPFGHEALIAAGLLSFERPMVVLHEIAHVRGYAHEGEASFVAFLGAVHSSNPRLRYSGWLSLWRYLRSQENDRLLDLGPLEDLEAVDQRIRGNRVALVSQAQSRILDVFLKVNHVDDGIQSYANIVSLAVGTRHVWGRFESQ